MQVHFNIFAFFLELNTCLLHIGCLLNRGGHKDRFYYRLKETLLAQCVKCWSGELAVLGLRLNQC